MKILLIGGTGAIGAPLMKILAERGDDVYVTSRRIRENEKNITYVRWNGQDEEALTLILEIHHWDVIVDFLVYGSFREFPAHLSNIKGHTEQYIFISSARVFAESPKPITETTPRLLDVCKDKIYLKTDEYALRKARCENLLNDSDINYTIVRPSVTFNSKRLQLGVYEKEMWLDRMMLGYPVAFSHDIASKITTLTYGVDVARIIAGLCGNRNAYREDYNAVSSEFYTWQVIADLYLSEIRKKGYKPKVKYIDSAVNLKIPSLSYQVRYARLVNRQFDNSKIRDLLPELSFSDVKTELRRCVNEYLNEGKPRTILSIVSLLQDKATGFILPKDVVGSWIRYIKYLIGRFSPEKLVIKKLSRVSEYPSKF